MNEINLTEIKNILENEKGLLLDIREVEEFEDFNIGGTNIPLHEMMSKYDMLSKFKHIIVVCSNGTRSSIAARILEGKLPESKIYHLTDGIF